MCIRDRLAQGRQDVHGREHPGVRVEEVLEVVVRGVLTAEDRVLGGHHGLDERVAHTGPHGAAAVRLDQLGHGLRGDEVVDHRGLLLARGPGPGDLALGHDRGHGGGGDRLAVLVPVSYTHLDVYKRQAQPRVRPRRCTPNETSVSE